MLAAACVGDALGAATEGMHRDAIGPAFGGAVTWFQPPPVGAPFARGLEPGRLTDDATQMLAMAEILRETGGRPAIGDAVRGLLRWSEDADVFARFAGPTTRIAVEALRAGTPHEQVADPGIHSCVFGTSNGAAMRAPAAGCAAPGKVAEAACLAVVLSAPTHNTQIAFAGAAAVASAVAFGLGGGGFEGMLSAAAEGGDAGEGLASTMGRLVGGPSVARRLSLAADIGARFSGDPAGAMAELEAMIGNGVAMAEAVPTALGLLVASGGRPWPAIVAAVNGGNDSDTIALIAGAIGAAYGESDVPENLVVEVERVNGIDLSAVASGLANLGKT